MKVICLEGLPRTGKSTFIRRLDRRLCLVPEYYAFLRDGEFPEMPRTLDEFVANQQIFLRIEQKRILLLQQTTSDTAVVDRCYLSNVAYAYALGKVTGEPFYEAALELHREKVSSGELIVPSTYVYFCEHPETVLQRINERPDMFQPVWREYDFLSQLFGFYENYFGELCRVPVLTPETFDTTDVQESVRDNGLDKLYCEGVK